METSATKSSFFHCCLRFSVTQAVVCKMFQLLCCTLWVPNPWKMNSKEMDPYMFVLFCTLLITFSVFWKCENPDFKTVHLTSTNAWCRQCRVGHGGTNCICFMPTLVACAKELYIIFYSKINCVDKLCFFAKVQQNWAVESCKTKPGFQSTV